MQAKKVFAQPYPPNYNVVPTTFQPIVRESKDEGEYEMMLDRWGLVPFFAESDFLIFL